jgi:signal transduction histidine kinase/DNA-binding response OmpR family regulator
MAGNRGIRRFFSFESNVLMAIVIAGITVVSIGAFAYRTMTDIVKSVSDEAKPDLKLVLLKDILSDLSDAESSVKSYSITNNSSYLSPFYRATSSIDEKIQELNLLSRNDPDQQPIIDSVSYLIEEKFIILNELMLMQDDNRVDVTLKELADKLRDRKNNRVRNRLAGKNGKPAVEDKVAKPGIFERLFGRKSKPVVTQEDVKTHAETTETAPLASVSDVEHEINRIKLQEARLSNAFKRSQLELTGKDKLVMDHIRTLIKRLEDKERRDILMKTNEAEQQANKANMLIGVFCVAVSLLLFILGYAIISYTRKNTAYKRALGKAIRHAENLAEAKETFLANMSHEIRTPMNAIIGFTDQLMKSDLDAQQAEQLSIVKKSGDHLLKLINEILDLSKLGAGKLRFEHIPFRPVTVFEEVVTLMKQLAGEKNLRLSFHTDLNLPHVLIGDPVRLRQVLLNLTGNAIKFTSKGEVRIEATVLSTSEAGIVLECRVRDTGIGIPKHKLPLIFDEFEQAESSTTRQFGGSGLGLSISRKLVEQQKGTITADSEEGHGTVITFTLPFAVGHEEALPEAVESHADGRVLTGKKMLIADDAEYNRKLLVTILKGWGVEYREAADGKEVLDALKKEDFDVILMDMLMPGMDGLAATRYIRSKLSGKKQHIPVIALTAASSEDVNQRCRDAGMNDCLSKPFKEGELADKIISLLGVTAKREPEEKPAHKKQSKAAAGMKGEDYDLSTLRSMSNGSETFVDEMVEIFIRTTQEGIDKIKESIGKQEWEEVADHAHHISSPCRHIGAMKLLEVIREMEGAARGEKNIRKLPSLFLQLESTASRVIAGLREELRHEAV